MGGRHGSAGPITPQTGLQRPPRALWRGGVEGCGPAPLGEAERQEATGRKGPRCPEGAGMRAGVRPCLWFLLQDRREAGAPPQAKKTLVGSSSPFGYPHLACFLFGVFFFFLFFNRRGVRACISIHSP